MKEWITIRDMIYNGNISSNIFIKKKNNSNRYVCIDNKDTELALTILVIKIISLKIKIIQNESTQYKTEVSFGIEI